MKRTFGSRLREVRGEQGISLRQLAKMVGITYQGIHKIEMGNADPKLSTIQVLMVALNIPSERLIDCNDVKIPLETKVRKPRTISP